MSENFVSHDKLKDLVCVVLIGGNDSTTRAIVERELGAQNIKYFIEGSVVYAVLVFKQDAKRAAEILKNEEALKTGWHQFVT